MVITPIVDPKCLKYIKNRVKRNRDLVAISYYIKINWRLGLGLGKYAQKL